MRSARTFLLVSLLLLAAAGAYWLVDMAQFASGVTDDARRRDSLFAAQGRHPDSPFIMSTARLDSLMQTP